MKFSLHRAASGFSLGQFPEIGIRLRNPYCFLIVIFCAEIVKTGDLADERACLPRSVIGNAIP